MAATARRAGAQAWGDCLRPAFNLLPEQVHALTPLSGSARSRAKVPLVSVSASSHSLSVHSVIHCVTAVSHSLQ